MLFCEIEYFLERGHAFPGKRSSPRVAEPGAGIQGADLLERQQMHLPFAVRRAVQSEIVDGDDPRIPRDLQIGFDESLRPVPRRGETPPSYFRARARKRRGARSSRWPSFPFPLHRRRDANRPTTFAILPDSAAALEMFGESCAQDAFWAMTRI